MTALHVGVDATTWANDRGFGRFTRELMKALIARRSGIRYTLVFDRPPAHPPAGADILTAATARSLNESAVGEKSRSLLDLWRLAETVRKARFDVFFFPAVYSYYPVLSKTPCVICYHDCTAERFPEYLFPSKLNQHLWRLKTWLALRQTKRAMTVTETSARDIESILRVPRSRIDVVTEGADPVYRVLADGAPVVAARNRYGAQEGDDLLVTLGGMNAHKNILGLLHAMPAVIARRPNVRLAIVGDTSGKGFWDNVPELMEFVRTHPPLEQHVRFTGYLSDEDVVALLNGASALVFPSLWEGFGLPAVEAMQCGVPVLASNAGALPEVVGDAGLFYEPRKPEEISARILLFLEDQSLRARLRQAALARARRFSWGRAAELAEASLLRCHQDALQK
jgi:glycosyltransferase involved in cell wall biosynthesis